MKKLLLSAFTLIASCFISNAQTGNFGANYTYQINSGTYTALTTPTVLSSGAAMDDAVFTVTLSSGFSFNGASTTTLIVTENGYLSVGTDPASYNPLSNTATGNLGIIAPFGRDLGGIDATSELSWAEVGNEAVFQWKNVKRYTSSAGEILSFQARLDKTTGVITFVYGTVSLASGSSTTYPQVGLRGAATGWAANLNNLMITNTTGNCSWQNATTGSANSSTMYFDFTNSAVAPASGLQYIWTPGTLTPPVRTIAAVSAIGTTSVVLNYTQPAGTPTGYNVQYRAANSCVWSNAVGNPYAAAATLTLTGLTQNTNYEYRIQAIYTASTSIYSHVPTAFTTLATCPATSNSTVTAIGSNSAVATWTVNGTETAWDIFYGPTPLTAPTATTVPTATSSANSFTFTGLNSLTGYAVYVRANCGAGDLSNWAGPRSFTTTALATDLQALQLVSPIVNATGCYGTHTVTVRIKNTGSTILDFSTNNATVIANITGVNPQSYTATVTTGTLAANTGTMDVVVTTSYNMSGVGTHTFNASATLATPDLNIANNAITAVTYTTTGPATLPQLVNFTGYTGTPASISTNFAGWNEGSGAVTPTIAGDGSFLATSAAQTTAFSAGAKMNLYNTNSGWIISPKVVPTAAHVFKYKATVLNYDGTTAANLGANDTIRAMVSTNCGSSWTALRTFNSANNQGLNNTTNVLREYTESLAAYAGQEIMVAIYARRSPTGTTPDIDILIDDLQIDLPPACPVPTGVTVVSTPTTAVASWTAGATETAWDVYYGQTPLSVPSASTAATATTASTSYSLTGISPSTSYAFYVRANCGAGNMSVWTLVNSFTTPCLPPNVLTTNGGSRCGIGTTTLSATADPGAVLNWYAAVSGGSAIATGSVLTTPTISANTNFYVSAGNVYPGTKSVGNGTNTGTGLSYNLTQGGYGGLKGQYLITAAELTNAGIAAGNITSLAFELTAVGSTLNGFAIEVGTTTLTTFAASAQNIQGGLTTVYPAATFTPALGMNTINFSTPFNWNGTSNIIVSISWSNNNTSNTSSTIKYDATSYYASQTYRKDSETAANMFAFTGATGAGTFSFGSSQDRPKFTFVGSVICESPRTMVTATVTSPPVLTLSSPAAVCAGSGIATLSVTSTLSDYDSYSWTPTTGLFTDAAATVPYTGTASTVYVNSSSNGVLNYNVTANNSVSGCATTGTASVTINAAPTSITLTANPNPVCASSTVSLSISANPTTPIIILNENFNAVSNSWTVVDNSSTSVTDLPWQLATDGSSNSASEVIHSNDNSQFILTDANSSPSSLTVNTTLTSPAFSTQGFTSATLDFYHYYYYGSATYHDDGVVRISTDNTNWTVVTTYTTNQGAPTNFAHAVLPIPAAFVNQPVVYIQFQSIGGWGYYWHLDNVTVSGESSAAYSYNWTSSPAAFTATTSSTTDMPTSNTTYSVVITNTATSCSNSSSVAVTVNPLPTVTAATSNTTVCAGSTATLTAGGATNYTWTAAGTASTQVVTPTAASVYTVTGETAGCSNTATVSVGVNAIPVVTAISSQTLLCDDGSTGAAILTASTSASTYLWSDGATTMTTAVTPTTTTTYTVTVTELGCSADAFVTVTVSNCNGVKELIANGINLYPNPTNGILNIAISSELAGNTSIEVYDAIGKLVIKETLSTETTTINTAKLTDGIYVFKVINNNQAIKIGKIVKQ